MSTSDAFRTTFSFLADTDAERALLEQLALRVTAVRADAGRTEWVFDEGGRRGQGILRSGPPHEGPIASSVPPSYAALAARIGRTTCGYGGGGSLGFPGLTEEGELQPSEGAEALEEGDPDELVEQLADRGLSLGDLRDAFYCGQNWLLFDPLRVDAAGEPMLAFVSHEGCEWEALHGAEGLSYRGVLLRLLVWGLLGTTGLIEGVYS
ncbi:MAG: hypothetical protein ABMA64_40300 [Myxococcota bacterium]